MSKYIDYKSTIWGRIHFKDDTNLSKIIKKLKKGYLPFELCDEELGFNEFEILHETEEFIQPIDNEGCSTIEVYTTTDIPKCIWDNSIKLKTKKEK